MHLSYLLSLLLAVLCGSVFVNAMPQGPCGPPPSGTPPAGRPPGPPAGGTPGAGCMPPPSTTAASG